MCPSKSANWFKDWFNSPYYHLLYKNRDCDEAELFIKKLISQLQPPKHSRFLDLACGKGRHAFYLNKMGFDVTGIDLSTESIACANIYQNDTLHFYAHDMRKTFRTNYFDYVVNLFTSFGYFENERDDYATIEEVYKGLKSDGVFIIDFMNSEKVMSELKAEEIKVVEGIEFKIQKSIRDNFIVKTISFADKGENYTFEERVKALKKADFEKYLEKSKLKILNLWGDYNLNSFDPSTSDRLIIAAKK